MAKTTRNLVLLAVMVLGMAGTAVAGNSRVRTDSATVATLIAEASARSVTFRSLVEAIDATDGIVFVSEGKCKHGVAACLYLTVTKAGPNRLLRIAVDTRKADWDVMGSIGHELQHAMEVLSDVRVDSDAAIFLLYKQIGSTSGDRFETEAAIKAGNHVRKEARQP